MGVSKKYVVDFKSDGDDSDDDSAQATCTTILIIIINDPNTLHQPVSVVTEQTKNIGPDQKQTRIESVYEAASESLRT